MLRWIEIAVILSLLGFLLLKNQSVSVFATKESCELTSEEECVFPICGHIPKGESFKKTCGVDFDQGWITMTDFSQYSDRLTTTIPPQP